MLQLSSTIRVTEAQPLTLTARLCKLTSFGRLGYRKSRLKKSEPERKLGEEKAPSKPCTRFHVELPSGLCRFSSGVKREEDQHVVSLADFLFQ